MSKGWFDQVSSYVRVAVSTHEGITTAFVSNDGRHVIVTAPTWTEELSGFGARLIAALLRELKPDTERWVEGGFTAAVNDAPEGSVRIYRRGQ